MTKPDEFDIETIENSAGVAAIRFLPRTDSTNDSAMAWIREGTVPTPALVLTADQTRGRGQRDRSWFSVPGNLAASWIVAGPAETAMRTEWAGRISIAAALAVHDTIAAEMGDGSHNLHVKWPNDVYAGNRKISGVLIETLPGPSGSYGVIGIGINVNRPVSATDSVFEEVSNSATSIRQHVGQDIGLTELVVALSRNLNRRVDSLDRVNSEWVSEYNSRLMSMNRKVIIKTSGPEIRGWCRGINSNGALRIESASGFQLVTSGSLFEDSQSIADGPAC